MKYFNLLWNLYQLKRNTVKTKKQMKNLQRKKLSELLEYAYDNSKYYRRSFERAGISKKHLGTLPLSSFPTIDKSILMKNFDDLVTTPDLTQEALRQFDAKENADAELFNGKYHVVHSSGSTGKPSYFVYDENAWDQMLLGIIRAALWNMTMPQILTLLRRGPRIAYIAATDGRYGGAMAVSGGAVGLHAAQMLLDIKTPLSEWIENINDFKPNIIIGYPSAIKILGELVEQGQTTVDALRVISCGEPLSAGMRAFLEKSFHAEVVNIYGASESLALGVETGHEDGMILFDDMNCIEVENGIMYLTSLYNYAQPLIRYRITDHLVLKAAEKNSIFPFTRTEILLGRDEDLLWFTDEKGERDFLHPLAVEGFCIEGLRDYQFIQMSRSSFKMLAEASGDETKANIRKEMLGQMGNILNEKKINYVQFHVDFTEEILSDPQTGKKRLILNQIKGEGLAA